ncbi:MULTISPECIES: ABC transporter ATP-binding protein [Brachybacterium]|uniref:ABC transporter ATP-binding protein n=2 Tax=Brachybacterium TaxID=43668 RepID=A0A3R8SPR9_9MICO|nr:MULTISPECIES: ABC transporter ATP-binding protein [Brachybacterium]RRR18536.1 ABC transporter ATP-binding protein [Brachybacterium paraconglomeratum]GLI30187.1 ABC transporter [Brachybacterium conglomeratum]GLK04725.1 ABC transporter [Brachybacterium conglomeratum]
MITFENVTVRFGDFTALPDLSLHVEEGEFFTLLGPSGCGKSTALRTLAGFNDPASGRLLVDGRDVTALPSDRRGIGMVFQNYALFPSMSVRENIAFGLKVAKRPKDEVHERVHEIAEQVALTPAQLDKGVAELSGGQQQRVAIARALVLRPRILLLDEPLSNLDAKLRNQLRVQLKELQQQFGITSIYVTHDQDEAMSMSDRIAVLDHGRIEQVGTPREVYERSATEFVCTFIGSVHRLGEQAVSRLSQLPGSPVAEGLRSYVRVERLTLRERHRPNDGRLVVDGVVDRADYHGYFTQYAVRLGDRSVSVRVPWSATESAFAAGDEVAIGVAPEDVLQYERSGPEAGA